MLDYTRGFSLVKEPVVKEWIFLSFSENFGKCFKGEETGTLYSDDTQQINIPGNLELGDLWSCHSGF